MKEKLCQMLAEAGMSEYQDLALSILKPAIHLITKRNDQLEIGCSKIGGHPDLPPEVVYPTYGEGKKQTFLAQYRLADLAPFSVADILPSSGMLYFFHIEHLSEDGYRELSWQCPWEGWKVIYWDGDPATLQPAVDEDVFTYPQAEIQFSKRYSYDLDQWSNGIDGVSSDVLGDIEAMLEELDDIDIGHQLLGHPVLQQNWDGERDIKDLVLLLQLDTDREVDMMWGDCGTLYFLIAPEDLKKRDFSNIFYEYQWG